MYLKKTCFESFSEQNLLHLKEKLFKVFLKTDRSNEFKAHFNLLKPPNESLKNLTKKLTN